MGTTKRKPVSKKNKVIDAAAAAAGTADAANASSSSSASPSAHSLAQSSISRSSRYPIIEDQQRWKKAVTSQIDKFMSKDIDFQILSTIRYDPMLGSGDNLDNIEDNFFLLVYHRERIQFTIDFFKWGFELTYEHLLKEVSDRVKELDTLLPYKLRVLISKDGAMRVEAYSVPPRIDLFSGLDPAFCPESGPSFMNQYGADANETTSASYPAGAENYADATWSSNPATTFASPPISPDAAAGVGATATLGNSLVSGHNDPLANYPPVPAPPSDLVYDVYIDSDMTSISPFTSFKTTHRDHYNEARARSLPHLSTHEEVLLYNARNEVTEGSITNVAFWRNDKWVTPMIGTGCLCGVVRQYLLGLGILTEERIMLPDVKIGERILLFNGVNGVFSGIIRKFNDRAQNPAAE